MLDCIAQKEAGMDEGELANMLGLTRAKVKYHLTVLRNVDLIAPVERVPDRYVAAVAGV